VLSQDKHNRRFAMLFPSFPLVRRQNARADTGLQMLLESKKRNINKEEASRQNFPFAIRTMPIMLACHQAKNWQKAGKQQSSHSNLSPKQ